MNGKQPKLSAFSLVHESSSIGYYIAVPGNWKRTGAKQADAAQQSIELRITHTVGDGLREDICVTNHTQILTQVDLALEIASDFIGPTDTPLRARVGKVSESWFKDRSGRWKLLFEYRATHRLHHQDDRGTAHVHRSVTLELHGDDVKPKYRRGKVEFQIRLQPHGEWRQHLEWVPQIYDQTIMRDQQISTPTVTERNSKQQRFLSESTQLVSAGATTFPALVVNTLERSRRDLAALRLFDLDDHDDAGETWDSCGGTSNLSRSLWKR